MRIAIVGSGSLGLLWAARILKTEHELVLFTRTQQQKTSINENGITLVNYKNEQEHHDVTAESVASYFSGNPFDLLLVTVKQMHVCKLVPFIQSITQPDSQILFVQNGLGHEEKIKCLYNRSWTYAMITSEGALRLTSHCVHHTGRGNIWMGRFPGDSSSFHPHIMAFMQSINELGEIKIHRENAIVRRMWEKLLINCVINPLTALSGLKNGELLSSCYSGKVNKVISEAVHVAKKVGLPLSEEELKEKVYAVCNETHMNFSSTVQDIRRGMPTEIKYLNGTLVKWGKKVGISTPYNEELLVQIEKLEVDNGHKRNNPFSYQ